MSSHVSIDLRAKNDCRAELKNAFKLNYDVIVFKSLNSYCNTFQKKEIPQLIVYTRTNKFKLARSSFFVPHSSSNFNSIDFLRKNYCTLESVGNMGQKIRHSMKKRLFSFFFDDLRDGIFLHKFLPQFSWLHASLAGLRQSLPNPMTINIINSSCSHPDEVFINTKLFIILSLKRSCCYGLLIFFIIFIYLLGGTLCVCAKCVPFSPFSA